MLRLLLVTLGLVGIAMMLLGVRIFFFKNKRFPNIHVSGNKYLREKKIYCVQTQDRQAREEKK